MFNDVGNKLISTAKITLALGVIGSIGIFAFLFFGTETESFASVIYLISGLLGSWIISIILYGIGEIVEKTNNIHYRTEEIEKYIEKKQKEENNYMNGQLPQSTHINSLQNAKQEPAQQTISAYHLVKCSNCGKDKEAELLACPYCGARE